MGWTGLISGLIDFQFETRGHSTSKGLPTGGLTLSTRYSKLDDSIFVLCRNCGHSLKTEELKKMAAFTGTAPPPSSTASTRFRSSPKHFLTWSSAANNRIQKMSKHIVSKLQTKMQNHLHSSQHQQQSSQQHQHHHHPHNHNHQQHDQFQQHCDSDSSGGFQNKQISCDPDCLSSSVTSLNSTSAGNNNNCERGKRTRFSFRNKNNSNYNSSSSSSANLIANISTENILKNNNGILINNNSFVRDNNNHLHHHHNHHHQSCTNKKTTDGSSNFISSSNLAGDSTMNTNGAWPSSLSSSKAKEVEYRNRNRRKSSSLVKSLELDLDVDNINNMLEMRPVLYGGSMNISVLSDSKNSSGNSSGESCRSNIHNSSSTSTISTAPTVPIMSPQWSRASSISIGSTTTQSQCDNHTIQSPPTTKTSIIDSNTRKSPNGNNNNNNNNNSNNLNVPSGDETRTSSTSSSSSSSTFPSPLSGPVTISTKNSSSSTTHLLNSSTNKKNSPRVVSSAGGAIVIDGNGSQVKTKRNSFENSTVQQQQHKLNGTSSNSVATSTLPNSKMTVTIFEDELDELRNESWFQAGLPREIALEVLRNEPIGSFIVRESTTHELCFALSLRVPREFQPTGIVHYLILRTGRGYKIKGFTKEFGSLTSLITHHSVMPELLPCPLALHRYKPSPHRVSRLSSIDFFEPEKILTYRKFTDF